MPIKKVQFRFLIKWILSNVLFLGVAYMLIAAFGIFIIETFSLPKDEWGTPFQQTIWKIGDGIIIGFSLGFIQWRLLRKDFGVSSLWIYSVAIGIVLTELIVGLVLWKLEINRGEFSFWENNPIPHALITATYGLFIGLAQLPLLKKHFIRCEFWVIASILAWGAGILITAIKVTNDIFLLVTFILGLFLCGMITGITLMFVLRIKDT